MKRTILALALAGMSCAAYAGPPMLQPMDVDLTGSVYESHLTCADTAPGSECVIANLTGKGTFLSAMVTKQGGANDISFVYLIIDGKDIFHGSIAALKNFGLTQHNARGQAVFSADPAVADIDTVVIGFPYPIPFETSLVLKVSVGTYDTGVVQITGSVIAGSR